MTQSQAFLRTTVIQAFARTVVNDSEKGPSEPGRVITHPGKGESGAETPAPTDETKLPVEGDVVGEHYRLVRLLGKGMFGRVYVAERVDVPEHQVALKLLPRSVYQGRNVERELVMLATVGHPHVVSLKDHGTTPDYVWLTMPVYEGETLGERLDRGCLSLREAHGIFTAIARGLDALHAAGLRHQDVKPDNIFLARFGKTTHPILLDLGVAAEKEAGFVAGTALFASPEQIASLNGVPGIVPLSEKMDTYCLATTILMALVGPKHFPGDAAKTREEIAAAQEVRATRPLEPDALLDVEGAPRDKIVAALCRWLAIEADDRPTMNELENELDVLLEPEREEERQDLLAMERQTRALSRLKWVASLMLMGAAVTAGVVYWKRQTLALAGELEAAREQREQTFKNLDTCAASHKIASKNATDCKAGRERDQAEYQKALADMEKNGSATEAERAKQLQGWSTKLKLCEDNATAAEKRCLEEEAKLTASDNAAKAAVEKDRDELRALADKEKSELASAEEAKTSCERDRQALQVERDACKAALHGLGTIAPHLGPLPSGSSPTPIAPPSPPPTDPGGLRPPPTDLSAP